MNNISLLFEENNYKVYKLTVFGLTFFVAENKASGQKYIRKCLPVLKEIIKK